MNRIQCFYVQGNYLNFITEENKTLKCRASIKKIKSQYPEANFVLASKGMMINPSYIEKIVKKELTVYLKGDLKVMVSQRNFLNVVKCYEKV